MSNPVNGLAGSALYNWPTTTSAGNRPTAAVTAGGQTFAQIAAGLGIAPQTYDTGNTGGAAGPTGGIDSDGAGSVGGSGSMGVTGLGSSTTSGLGATGATGPDQPGGTAGLTGSSGSGVPSAGETTNGVGATGTTDASSAAGATGIGAASGVGATADAGAAGSTGAGSITDLSGTDTFLKLLVAQLQNQDPTSPMDDQAFVTELAQFNTVEQMINLKQSIDTQTTSQQASEGIGLLGRTISYATTAVGSNNTVTSQGAVTGVSLAGGKVELQVGTRQVALSAVTAVTA